MKKKYQQQTSLQTAAEDNDFKISVALGCISVITAGPFLGNPSVCTPFSPGPSDPPRPSVTYPQYTVRIEANILNKNYTENYIEWYDSINNRAAFKSTIGGRRKTVIYNFANNELYTIDDSNQCTVSDLAKSSALTLFGRQVAGQDKAQIFSAGSALWFSKDIPAKWINRTSVRGIPCDMWRSCAYWPTKNATMVLDWYFSALGRWSTTGMNQVPIRAHVKGAAIFQATGLNHTFEHTYDFVDFDTNVPSSAFLTPESVYCPGRKQTKSLPTPANNFHFTAEILDINNNQIGFIREFYDAGNKLVRFEMTPMGPSVYGTSPLTQIDDFNTGITYVMDNYRGNCSITNISSSGFDVHVVSSSIVQLRTAKQFFYFDKTKYNYEGQKMVRGMNCDVWITQRNDWPPGSPGLSTWEWYFATNNYTADLPDRPSFGMPVRMEAIAYLPPSNYQLHYIYNIYNYDEKPPALLDNNIGQCFNSSGRQDYNFIIPASFRATVNGNMKAFKLAVQNALKSAGQIVSVLRINNIQVDYADNNDIIVYFTLFDRPPPIGDVASPAQEPDLPTVRNRLTNVINNGNLKITFNVPNAQPVVMTAKQNTLLPASKSVQYKHYTKSGSVNNTGYSGGVMAGMGVALAVVFFALGVVGMFFFKRSRTDNLPSVKFQNEKDKEDITQDFS